MLRCFLCYNFIELARRQEELRKIEEDMQSRRQMAQLPPPHMRQGMNNRDRGRDMGRDNFDNRGPPRGGPPQR